MRRAAHFGVDSRGRGFQPRYSALRINPLYSEHANDGVQHRSRLEVRCRPVLELSTLAMSRLDIQDIKSEMLDLDGGDHEMCSVRERGTCRGDADR
jgi:hypothetical protein